MKINSKNIYNPKPLKQLARGNIKLDDKQLNREIAKKMLNSYYFTDRMMQVGLNITLESHHINQTNSKKILKPNNPDFGIEVRYINKIIKELYDIYARLMNKHKFKYQTIFPARFDKQDEDNQILDETKLFITLNIN